MKSGLRIASGVLVVASGLLLGGLVSIRISRAAGAQQCPPNVYCPPAKKAPPKKKPVKKVPVKKPPKPPKQPAPPKIAAHRPERVLELPFNPTVDGQLEAQTSGLQIIETSPTVRSFIHYNDYSLRTPPNAPFSLQFASDVQSCEVLLFEQQTADTQIPLKKDQNGEFVPSPANGVMPVSGDYLVRVQYRTGEAKPAPIAYALRARKPQPGLDDPTDGTIHWQTSRRVQNPTVANAWIYADDYQVALNRADRVTLQFAPGDPKMANYFSVRLYDPQARQEVPLVKEGQSQDYLITRSGVPPRTGAYQLIVQYSVADPKVAQVPYRFTFRRRGISRDGYRERMSKITASYLDNSDSRNITKAVEELNKLKALDPALPEAYELLGRIYFTDLRDYSQAEEAMRQAIERGGQVSFRVRFDLNQIKKPGNKPVELAKWKTPRLGELEIRSGQIRLTETGDQALLILTPQMISGLSSDATAMIAIRPADGKTAWYVLPERQMPVEAELIRRLIDRYGRGLPSASQ
ncbi:MAG TPA: hypothetical protein VNQ79_12800 [Blastocatellia bacterium]|nr:hypothetical protein [Blastocatellia bacterium]